MKFIHYSYLLFALATTTLALAEPSSAHPRTVVGAIRWDAWVGDASAVGLAVEKTLSPERWHYRLPFYGRILTTNQVEVRANSPAIMDREIALAKSAGLDYWAFCLYEPADAMTRGGLDIYLASAHRQDLHFCLILQGGQMASWAADWPLHRDRLVHYFRQPSYQPIGGGRPLVFILEPAGLMAAHGFTNSRTARAALQDLRQATIAAGLPNPYLVAMDWSPAASCQDVIDLGLDAVSSYASNGGASAAPYGELTAYTQNNWDAYAATGCPVVPWVTTGWDRRPRVENPVFWETPYGRPDNYYQALHADELAGHLHSALDWNRAHPRSGDANAVIIYAWNEFDEGGWLAPTLTEGTARLDALRSILRPAK